MARKLKTYQTSLGFFDQAIAAPSMKAALDAWGAESNLFTRESRKKPMIPTSSPRPSFSGALSDRMGPSGKTPSCHRTWPVPAPADQGRSTQSQSRRSIRLGRATTRRIERRHSNSSDAARRRPRGRRSTTAREGGRQGAGGAGGEDERHRGRARRSGRNARKPKIPAGRSRGRSWTPLCAAHASSTRSGDRKEVHSDLGRRPLPPHFAHRPGKILRPGAISRGGWRPVPLQAWHLISAEPPFVMLRRRRRRASTVRSCAAAAAWRCREACS